MFSARTVPALTVMPPCRRLYPDSTSVPEPLFVRPPVPLRIDPEMVVLPVPSIVNAFALLMTSLVNVSVLAELFVHV